MAWVNWPRKAVSATPAGLLGVEWNAGRARAALVASGQNRVVVLDEPHAELPLAISLEGRIPVVGRSAETLLRRLPHLACTGYLPALGENREWIAGKHHLTPVDAVGLSLRQLKIATAAHEGVYLGLPAYLTHPQISRLRMIATKEQLPLRGTVSTPLAIAAVRAGDLSGLSGTMPPSREGVVPLHRLGASTLPADAMVVDADDDVLTISVFRIEPTQALHLATIPLVAHGVRFWKDRLVNALADRCVRVCRRDPRDSGEAEQSLYEQIDAGLDRVAVGKPVTLTVRSAHWYQDMTVRPDEWTSAVAAQVRAVVSGVREMLGCGSVPQPPRAVWLTHEVGRLPGLAQAIALNTPEVTCVTTIAPEAAAFAIACLVERWPGDEHVYKSIAVPAPAATPTRTRVPSATSLR